jgi:hypothetical protein
MTIKTASWFADLPADYVRISISRSIPRRQPAGYRIFRPLAPGRWFSSVDADAYRRMYQREMLDLLDPHQVAAQLRALAGGATPVLCCWERAGSGAWCHRALAAAWLSAAIGAPVPEVGFETLPQDRHPMRPPPRLRL